MEADDRLFEAGGEEPFSDLDLSNEDVPLVGELVLDSEFEPSEPCDLDLRPNKKICLITKQ